MGLLQLRNGTTQNPNLPRQPNLFDVLLYKSNQDVAIYIYL